jgi:hypothetical protein
VCRQIRHEELRGIVNSGNHMELVPEAWDTITANYVVVVHEDVVALNSSTIIERRVIDGVSSNVESLTVPLVFNFLLCTDHPR